MLNTCWKYGVQFQLKRVMRRTCVKNKVYSHLLPATYTCKRCKNISTRLWRKNNREKARFSARLANRKKYLVMMQAKNKPCIDCGRKYPPYVMDFDHLYDKKYNLGGQYPSMSQKEVLQEIEKCEVVCANCHRERTHGRTKRKENGGIINERD